MADPKNTSVSPYPVKILTALHAVMGSVGYVQKKGENKFQNYKYAGEANLLEVLRPAMVEAGLLLIPSHKSVSPIDDNGITTVCVEYTLAHKDGDVWPEKIIVYGSGGDRNSKGGVGDKGLYKALTGANKYLLFKLFQVETGDDPEKDAEHDKAPPPPKNAPGISEAKVWVREHIRDLEATDEGTDLIEIITAVTPRWVKICAVYPTLWSGENNSGLLHEGRRIASIYQCRDRFDQFVAEVQVLAANLKAEQK